MDLWVRYAVLGGDQDILKQIGPAIGLPIVERLDMQDEKRLGRLLDEVYLLSSRYAFFLQ
jgi:hypothetical protein